MTSRSIGSASRKLCSIAALVASLVAASGSASAEEKRIVLLEFEGPRAKLVRRDVLRQLKPEVTMVGSSRWEATKERLGLTGMSSRTVVEVARELGVHGIITGRVRRRGGAFQLEVDLIAGADGETFATGSIPLSRRGRLMRAGERKLRRLIDLLAELKEPPPLDEADDEAQDAAAVAPPPESPKRKKPRRKRLHGELEDEILAEQQARARKNPPRKAPAVGLSAGLSFTERSLTFNVAAGVSPPNGYDGTLVPGLLVAAEIYPYEFKATLRRTWKNHVGITALFDRALLLSSTFGNDAVTISTTQQRLGLGLLYRWLLRGDLDGPQIRFVFGFKQLTFALDQQAITDAGLGIELPNVTYSYIDPGVAGRLPFTKDLAGYADARFMYVLGVGDFMATDIGYGDGSTAGLDSEIGAEYQIDARLMVRAGLRLQRIGFSFDGNGILTDRNRDGLADVGGAVDQYYGGYAAATYLF
jgi:hypothetical protein